MLGHQGPLLAGLGPTAQHNILAIAKKARILTLQLGELNLCRSVERSEHSGAPFQGGLPWTLLHQTLTHEFPGTRES